MAMKPKVLLGLAGAVLVALATTAGSLLAADAPQESATPQAMLNIVPVAANPADPNGIVETLPDGKTQAQVGTTGLNNVPIGVPVTLKGGATDTGIAVTKYAWTLTPPSESTVKLSTNNEPTVQFTPDVSGVYKVDLVVSNDAGSSNVASLQIHAGEYIGTGFGDCFKCHPQTTQEWSETAHANIFTDQINGGENPKTAEYGLGVGEHCIGCHTTGYYPGVANSGFGDVWAATGWNMPPAADVQAGKNNWANVPIAVQNMANIQCEDCHGPAKDHVTEGAPMAASLDPGVCNQCHNGSTRHRKGLELTYAAHSDATAQAWTYPVGPDRQACCSG